MLYVILYNSGLELLSNLSRKIIRHPSIQNDIKRRKKPLEKILIDLAFHQPALSPEFRKNRGRPDIVHHSLLQFLFSRKISDLGTKNHENGVKFIIHTINDKYFYVHPSWRIPIHYIRFRGLMENLFEKSRLKVGGDDEFIILQPGSLENVMEEIKGEKHLILFTSHGKEIDLNDFRHSFRSFVHKEKNYICLIGGFQHGSIPEHLKSSMSKFGSTEEISFPGGRLPSWKIICDLMYMLEFT